ncbi:hypothetical protein EDB92DRAFT_121274 [Lactarius akahatsu]|uniref:Uncharacterized protein n=1 Tax=Lactarius akahatsu TaxID=416441 RepID=A0AAD4Q6I9_9AGAM|nr:hypothetical protein EDB92DRAFT_121274 [Lactarius akahatsu]
MTTTLFTHTAVQGEEHSWDGRKHIYSFRDSFHDLAPSVPLPTSAPKECTDTSSNFSEPRFTRLMTNDTQRLHTELKGLWTSAPRSAHPAGAYERGFDYPRLFQLDASFTTGATEPSDRQGSKRKLEFQFATVPVNKVTPKPFHDRLNSTSGFNPVEPALQRAQDILSDTNSRDATMVHTSHYPYDDRLSQAADREVVTRESEPARGWRVTTLPPAAASYLRRWPVDADRPIRPRSLSEACDNGKRAFRALADWITIYLFVLVETGRLPQDGAIDRLPLWRSMTAFQSTRQLIHRILFATAVPHSAIFLALWYIFRLPISPQTVVYAQDTARARFRDSLKNGSAHLIEGYMMRVFTAGIMLADKWVNDQTFQLRTWHEITGIPKVVLRNLEVAAMGVLEYNLRVSGNEWQMWLGHLTSWHSALGTDPLMTIDTPPFSHALITTSLKDVVRASSRSEIRGTPEPSFLELQISRMTDERKWSATPSATSNDRSFPFSMSLPSHPLPPGPVPSQQRTTFSAPGHMKPWPGVRPTVSSF